MGKLKLTPVSYEEAAKIANKKVGTVRAAAHTGIITRLPSVGLVQQVIKEQVELFANKKQLRLSMLAPEELEKWQALNKAATNIATQEPAQEQSYSPKDVAQLLAMYEEKRAGLTPEQKKSSSQKWETSPSWVQLRDNLVGRDLNSGEVAVLLGLILLIVALCLVIHFSGKNTVNTFMVDTTLEQVREYTDQPELITSMVDEISSQASTPEETFPLLFGAVQELQELVAA